MHYLFPKIPWLLFDKFNPIDANRIEIRICKVSVGTSRRGQLPEIDNISAKFKFAKLIIFYPVLNERLGLQLLIGSAFLEPGSFFNNLSRKFCSLKSITLVWPLKPWELCFSFDLIRSAKNWSKKLKVTFL